ncbi:MAG: hypothetical protein KatS3mg033_2219 [Thermonema sp.]|jgi:DNA-binding transcriptional ArsR family regulator|uniref:ArsR/SmtB family transcription factor n=1 Tax=Thermonema sp. TaxID=2231181 RepID=UPI0021DEB237|nr:metalloregulator ArsR/SmtB family transcription factor [Thermonema sp.]GIV40419.1 MAG: hypothetical protein KatS3mg033_2219 [Thermonema sp.]
MRIKHFSLPLAAQLFQAFSDEARLRIMHLLWRNGKMTPSDLELILDYSQTKTSRHLAYLRNAGIVRPNRIDQWVFYAMKEEVKGVVEQLLKLVKDPTLQEDQKVYKTLFSNRELSLWKVEPRKREQLFLEEMKLVH